MDPTNFANGPDNEVADLSPLTSICSDLLRPLLRADPWKEGQDEVDASGHNLDHGGGGAGNLPKVITGTNTTFIMIIACPGRCSGKVFSAEKMVAASGHYHRHCFRCFTCNQPLDSTRCTSWFLFSLSLCPPCWFLVLSSNILQRV